MYERCPASLRMKRVILQNGFFNENEYKCQVITYNPQEENIYILMGEDELSLFSLDALYECVMETETEKIVCEGVIKERYFNKSGRIIVLYIRNGFYKNPLN